MSSTYLISVSIKDEATGVEVMGAPLTHRQTVDESMGPMRYERTDGGGYISLPTSLVLDDVQLLLVRPDKAMTFRLDGQTDAGIALSANGILLIVDGYMDAGPSTNVTAENASGVTAVLTAFAAGT